MYLCRCNVCCFWLFDYLHYFVIDYIIYKGLLLLLERV